MKVRSMVPMVKCALYAMCVSIVAGSVRAQSVSVPQFTPRALIVPEAQVGGADSSAQPAPQLAPAVKVERLLKSLSEADDTKKPELTRQLEAAVAEQFERDIEFRELELSKLDERLTKLRTQLETRRKAKTDIIQLQVKVLLNEAGGLGFVPLFQAGQQGQQEKQQGGQQSNRKQTEGSLQQGSLQQGGLQQGGQQSYRR